MQDSRTGPLDTANDPQGNAVVNGKECEALEACQWLRATGFPQYAQLYEDHQFPIDISSVQKDHDFLDQECFQALYRRLQNLNKSAAMTFQSPVANQVEKNSDSETEEECALSDKWVMEPSSRRWSRKLDELKEQHDDSRITQVKVAPADPHSYCPFTWPPPAAPPERRGTMSSATHRTRQQMSVSPRLRRAASERWKGAKTFLKRFESIKTVRPNKNIEHSPEKLEIGSPVVTNVDKMKEVMDRLGCREIVQNNSSEPSPLFGQYSGQSSPVRSVGGSTSPQSSHSTTPDLLTLESGYKPGTFPKILADSESTRNMGKNYNDFRKWSLDAIHSANPPPQHANNGELPVTNGSQSLPGSPVWQSDSGTRNSVYDNMPEDTCDPERVHVQEELDLILSDLLQDIKDLGQALEEPSIQKDSDVIDGDVYHDVNGNCGPDIIPLEVTDDQPDPDQDPDQQPEKDSHPSEKAKEGTDTSPSGGGVSSRLRWPSFVQSHSVLECSGEVPLWSLSAAQLMKLHKLSLLKVTGLLERFCQPHRSAWNRLVPKLIRRRRKSPDYKSKSVFGVPLSVMVQRTGQPLPQCMLHAMQCLRRSAEQAHGVFRKAGVRSRIQQLHNQLEANPASYVETIGHVLQTAPIQNAVDMECLHYYDVADLLKQYFRELPECLLTKRLSDTFIAIFTNVPSELRLEALQATVLLLPDENRHVLQALLYFLSDMAKHAAQNEMPASNLAICFAPTLFHLAAASIGPQSSPIWGRKMAAPDPQDLLQQKHAQHCLTMMITECKRLFSVNVEKLRRLSCAEMSGPLHTHHYSSQLEDTIENLLKHWRDKFKGWVSSFQDSGVDVSYRKSNEGSRMRLWKVATHVEAPPLEVLQRVLRERHVWDEDLLRWKILEQLDSNTEIFHYVLNAMAPQPTRHFVELRSWRVGLQKGACVMVALSVDRPTLDTDHGVLALTLASHYLIEPSGSGRTRLTYISQADYRGSRPEWYNKTYGHICANYIMRVRQSFDQKIAESEGPETQV